MAEPQIPGLLMGFPYQRYPRGKDAGPGYVEGPTPPAPGLMPAGNPNISLAVPIQRTPYEHTYRSWHW